ncbi:Tyrosine kinase specific for activated [Ceratobasidium sp. AG-Ba]|nr:Tyrosine kinase specific for activated [Ceratobasidium sp. AG-Ba]
MFQYLDQNPELNETSRLQLLKNVAAGTSHIHGLNIVHGDLKLANVVIDRNCRARICDFGSVFALEGCSECPASASEDFQELATYIYLSPEVWDDDEPMSYKSDVWALGCLFLEAQTGGRVYGGKHVNQIMFNMTVKKLPPATIESFSSNERTKEVGKVALSCWITDPNERPSAGQVVSMLERID